MNEGMKKRRKERIFLMMILVVFIFYVFGEKEYGKYEV